MKCPNCGNNTKEYWDNNRFTDTGEYYSATYYHYAIYDSLHFCAHGTCCTLFDDDGRIKFAHGILIPIQRLTKKEL